MSRTSPRRESTTPRSRLAIARRSFACATSMARLSMSGPCWPKALWSSHFIAAAGASLVAISPEKPDDTVSTAEKNALSFPVLSDVGHATGKAFGVVYAFTDDVRQVYDGV